MKTLNEKKAPTRDDSPVAAGIVIRCFSVGLLCIRLYASRISGYKFPGYLDCLPEVSAAGTQ